MALVVVATLLLLGLTVAITRPQRGLVLAVFLLPWMGLYVDVGLRITAYLCLFVPLTAVAGVHMIHGRRGRRLANSLGLLWLVLAYGVVWSLVQLPFLPEMDVRGGSLRGPVIRALLQIVMFLVTVAPVFVVPLFAERFGGLEKLVKAYVLSCVALAVVGWVQLAVWFATGHDPFPLGLTDQVLGGLASSRSGQFVFDGGVIYRMSSFGGEPKYLGVGLLVAILLLQAKGVRLSRYEVALWAFLFVSMIATFSTTALILWVVTTLAMVFVESGAWILSNRFRRWGISTRFASALVLLLILSVPFLFEWRLAALVEFQTVDRVSREQFAFLEDFNWAVVRFLQSEPVLALAGVGFGNAHLYAEEFLPGYAVEYAASTPFTAKSGLLRWISEIGTLSFGAFLVWFAIQLRHGLSRARSMGAARLAVSAQRLSIPLLIVWAASGSATGQFFMMCGGLVWLDEFGRGRADHR